MVHGMKRFTEKHNFNEALSVMEEIKKLFACDSKAIGIRI